MPVSPTVWIVSLMFGVTMGVMIGGRPEDRRSIRVVVTTVMILGAVIWLTGPAPMTSPAVAAVALSLGGLATHAGLSLMARRHPS